MLAISTLMRVFQINGNRFTIHIRLLRAGFSLLCILFILFIYYCIYESLFECWVLHTEHAET